MSTLIQTMLAQRLNRVADMNRNAGARILAALALLLGLTACANPNATQQTVVKAVMEDKSIRDIPSATPRPTAKPIPTPKPVLTATPAPTGQPVSLGTNGGEWQFDASTLEIVAGKDIALTFHNNAKNTTHNWLLVKGGNDVATEVNAAGLASGEATGYIPEDTRIIARTAGLIKGGQSATITFSAPTAGTYTYLCTFPGHFELGMQGVLTVR